MSAESIAESLANAGWDVDRYHGEWPGRARSFVSFRKALDDGVDVIVSVHMEGEEFHVWSSAEHRLSGPCDTRENIVHSLAAAMQAAQKVCDDWDSSDLRT